MHTFNRIEPLIYILVILFALLFVHKAASQAGGNAIDLYNENYLAHGDFIDAGSPDYGFSNKITVCAWVKWNVNPQTYINNHNEKEGRNADIVTIDNHIVKDNGQFWLQHSSSNSYFQWVVKTTNSRRTLQSSTTPSIGIWYYVVGVYDDTDPNYSMKIYINGSLENSDNSLSGNINPYNSIFRLNIGRLPSGYRLFAGELDEIRIYNRALTQSEIKQQMFSASTVDTTLLLSYWDFNQSSGTDIVDQGPMNIDGTFYSCLVDVHDTDSSPVYRIWDNDKNWTVNKWLNKQIVTVAGDGVGETNVVASNDAISLVFQNPWVTKPRLDDFGDGTGMTWYGIIDPTETSQWVRSTASLGSNTVFVNTTNQVSIGDAGALLSTTITSTPSSSNNLIAYIYGSASGSPVSSGENFPEGIDRRSDIVWAVNEWGSVTADLYIDFSSVSGISNQSTLVLLRRSRFSVNWSEVTSAVLDTNNKTFSLSGVTSFYEYALGGDSENPLPVLLSEFRHSVTDNITSLFWKTSLEINNSGFDIERKCLDAVVLGEWSKIGFLPGYGTTSEEHIYSISDRGLLNGSYAYRLKQIDYNGNFEYFYLNDNVTISSPGKSAVFQNYPNPSNPVSKIDFKLSVGGMVKLIFYDITGRVVNELVNEQMKSGYHTAEFNGSSLASGVYFYKFTVESGDYNYSEIKKLVLVK